MTYAMLNPLTWPAALKRVLFPTEVDRVARHRRAIERNNRKIAAVARRVAKADATDAAEVALIGLWVSTEDAVLTCVRHIHTQLTHQRIDAGRAVQLQLPEQFTFADVVQDPDAERTILLDIGVCTRTRFPSLNQTDGWRMRVVAELQKAGLELDASKPGIITVIMP